MKGRCPTRYIVLAALASGLCLAQPLAAAPSAAATPAAPEFELYPEAKRLPEKEKTIGKASSRFVTYEETYVTQAPYDEVVAFYQKRYPETNPMISAIQQQKVGDYELRRTFFTLDGALSYLNSEYWIRVQHPYFGKARYHRGKVKYSNVRNVTVITVVRKERRAPPTPAATPPMYR